MDEAGRRTRCVKYTDPIPLDSIRIRNVILTETGLLGARGEINSKNEFVRVLKTLPGGEKNVPEKWRSAPARSAQPRQPTVPPKRQRRK